MSSPHEATYRRVILVRHGESTANEKSLLTGRTDSGLTTQGLKQANAVAKFLYRQGWSIDALYSSPLKRALQTAGCISRREKLTIEESELLLETNFGAWEGNVREELKRFPQWETYARDPFHFQFPEGESPQDVCARVGSFMKLLRRSNDWSTAVVVSHYTPIAFFILHILGIEEGNRAPFALDNASITLIWMSDSSGYIENLNCTPF